MFIHRKKREQKKAVQAAISKAKRTDKKKQSAQDSIPYLLMRSDGICQVTQNHYTKTIQFRDINYQLSDNEDKQAIFDSWCDFLNYFDSSVSFQLSFINLTGLRGAALRTIPVRTDQFESIQRELSGVIQNQQDKTARLIFLDAALNLDAGDQSEPEPVIAKSSRPSILSRLKSAPPQSKNPKQKKHHEEVR